MLRRRPKFRQSLSESLKNPGPGKRERQALLFALFAAREVSQRGGGARRGSESARGTRLAVEALWPSREPVRHTSPSRVALVRDRCGLPHREAPPSVPSGDSSRCENSGTTTQVPSLLWFAAREVSQREEARAAGARAREGPVERSSPFGRVARQCAERRRSRASGSDGQVPSKRKRRLEPVARPHESADNQQKGQHGADPDHRSGPGGEGLAGVEAGLPAADLTPALAAGVVARLDHGVAIRALAHGFPPRGSYFSSPLSALNHQPSASGSGD